jgi:predicted anti-sigma-YlaC factor YlaD
MPACAGAATVVAAAMVTEHLATPNNHRNYHEQVRTLAQ